MSNLGRWTNWYAGLEEPAPYGDTHSYNLAALFLYTCDSIEDWGCGKGWFRTIWTKDYLGVDGTQTPFCDQVADLTTYTSSADGVLLRHVLEHNYEWEKILANAIQTARHKLCIILFTPLVPKTREIAFTADIGVPDIAFQLEDIAGPMEADGFEVDVVPLSSATQYGVETMVTGSR